MIEYKVDKVIYSEAFRREVYEVVSQIPFGKVTTYGTIAYLLGMPQCSRMVGRALKEVPHGTTIPCHRVVNSVGRLVPGWAEQKQRLAAEGVSLKANGCINLKEYMWRTEDVLV